MQRSQGHASLLQDQLRRQRQHQSLIPVLHRLKVPVLSLQTHFVKETVVILQKAGVPSAMTGSIMIKMAWSTATIRVVPVVPVDVPITNRNFVLRGVQWAAGRAWVIGQSSSM